MSAPRFAVFWRPPSDTPLGEALTRWFGDPAVAPLRRDPSRYGPHMTLFAPTPLAAGVDAGMAARAVAALAACAPTAILPPLRLDPDHGFLALRPMAPAPGARRLAALCVRALDGLRAPTPAPDVQRRAAAIGQDAAALARLARWGYPWVLGGFRPHITLGDHGAAAAAAPHAAATFISALDAPVAIDALTLMIEPAPRAAFASLGAWPCRGASSSAAA